jgi:hypothetical protein
MKKIMCLILTVLFLTVGLFAQNTVITTTLTVQSNGWYRIATNHYIAIEWQMRYTVGNSTSVTLTFARSKDDGPRVYYSERAADNTAENMTIILDDAAPVWRGWWMEIPQSADYVYVRIVFTGGNTGILLLEGYLDYAS